VKRQFAAVPILLAWSWQAASAVDVTWNKTTGSGLQIASNETGQPWLIGLDRVSESGYSIYSYSNGNWIKQAGAGRRITVDSSGRPWMVDDQNKIYRYDLNSNSWQMLPGLGTDIAAGGDGSIWLLGAVKVGGGYNVFKWDTTAQNWTLFSGTGLRIAAEKGGSPWVVNENGDIFRYDLQLSSWSQKPGKARSVHAGLSTGAVWVIGTGAVVGGYPVSRYIPETQTWETYGSFGAVEMTEAAGTPWIVQKDGSIYSKTPDIVSLPVSGTTTINTSLPPMTPQLGPPPQVSGFNKGKLVCSKTGTASCGKTKADYVGAYSLDLTCDEGFYDPIWGGTCWKCPEEGDKGPWLRSTSSIEKDDACWRVPKEKTGRATKTKSPAWAWECPSGSFHDLYSPDGWGGSCWKCPDSLPRRTANHVNSDAACATAVYESNPATFLTFNGCPKPKAEDMDLLGRRLPGKPFLDIGAGWSQGVASGGCYACPVADEAGNFLITERNAESIYNKDSNTGCTVELKYQPSPFSDPGLTYIQGVKDLIWEQRVLDTDKISAFLYDLAESQGHGDATPEAKDWVTKRWQEIAKGPYNNEEFRALMFTYLKGALNKCAGNRTPAERKLIRSFAEYVRARRIHIAENALAMYDAWKAYDDEYRMRTGQTRSVGQLLYYGTVPLDFHGTLAGLVGVGGTGGAVLGSLVTAQLFSKGVTLETTTLTDATGFTTSVTAPKRSKTVQGLVSSLKILKTVQGLKLLTGAALVQAAFAIVETIAFDQFIAIQEARPKLEASLSAAKESVDLDVLTKSPNGEDMLYFFWAKAMDTTGPEDPQVVQLAAEAHARAQQGGYLAPPKINETPVVEACTDQMTSGDSAFSLPQDEKLISLNKKFEAEMQTDGNFVIYQNAASRVAIWATGTNGKGAPPYRLAMQPDSNLVVYGSSGPTWASGIRSATAPYTLIMQDDGNLVIYDSTKRAIWASNTQR
jgi:hypothetical protein